jgi:hypothetical protein
MSSLAPEDVASRVSLPKIRLALPTKDGGVLRMARVDNRQLLRPSQLSPRKTHGHQWAR